MAFTYALHVNAPIERVFGMVDDPEKLKLWMEGLEETIYTTEFDPQNPVGAKFKQKIREGGHVQEYDGEVTAYDKPKHLAVRIFSPHFSVQVDYRFTAEGAGTRLDYSADICAYRWYIRLMILAFGWFTRRILRKQMTKLKELAERS